MLARVGTAELTITTEEKVKHNAPKAEIRIFGKLLPVIFNLPVCSSMPIRWTATHVPCLSRAVPVWENRDRIRTSDLIDV